MQKELDKKLWGYSLYFVIFGVLMLLNACIGFSSAPFYSTKSTCSPKTKPLTDDCLQLQSLSYMLYSIEIIGSVVLTFHGLVGLQTSEHGKTMCNMRVL